MRNEGLGNSTHREHIEDKSDRSNNLPNEIMKMDGWVGKEEQ